MPDTEFGLRSLDWTAWHRTASENLLASCRDSDPHCVVSFSTDAISAGREALKAAGNRRQRIVTEALLDAAHGVRSVGRQASTPAELADLDQGQQL